MVAHTDTAVGNGVDVDAVVEKVCNDELPVHSIAGNYYQHENFMKGREDLLKFISAKINKGETEERSQLRQRIITGPQSHPVARITRDNDGTSRGQTP